MSNNSVLQELIRLNNGAEDLAYEEENLWFSEKPAYTPFITELKETVKNEEIRGVILLATDQDIIWASGSRSVDVNGKIVTPLTTFEIGSVTKMYTATCICKLAEAGKLSLEDKVRDYFPAFEKGGDITVYDLLHMRSGLTDLANECETFFGSKELAGSFNRGEITDEVFFEHLYQHDLKFAPGTKMEYCNTNYVLLAMIVEKVTGKAYKDYVKEQIFTPLGMDASSATTPGDVTSVPEREAGYMKELHTARGAGDIHSNALNVLTFNRAFFNEKIVSHEVKETMLDFADNYGCGWESSEEHPGLVMHDGGTNSYITLNRVFHAADNRTYLIMLTCGYEDPEEEKKEAAGEETKNEAAGENKKFDQYQRIFDLCVKHLQ
ncbi:MAG: beta-lactamase family protein [Firmicutes bacterium]|nr:beta-lactamase family protein [Bacillota bacterium]